MEGKFALLLPVLLLLFGCKTTQPARPEPLYNMIPTATAPLSSLYVPVHITRGDLQRMVNRAVAGLPMSNADRPMDGFTWTLAIKRPMQVELDGKQIISVIPLDVALRKELGITSLRGNGELEVTLRTHFNIREDWSVQTYTTLDQHRWLRRPVAQVAGMNIPVSSLTNLILEYSRPQLTKAIDAQIKENVDLRALLAPLWTVLRRPVQVSETMDLWFRFEPRLAGIEAFTSKADGLYSAVHLSGVSRLKAGAAPELIDPSREPQFAMAASRKDSLRMLIHTEVPYDQAERIAEANLIGQTYGTGRQQVRIEGIDLFGQGDHLITSVRLSGSYKGTVHLRGKPVYNAALNRIEMADLDYDVQTRNVLHRSASWLFKSNIRSTFVRALVFPLEENLDQVRQEIQASLQTFSAGPWIRMEAGEMYLRLEDLYLQPEGFRLDFLLSGQLKIHLKAID